MNASKEFAVRQDKKQSSAAIKMLAIGLSVENAYRRNGICFAEDATTSKCYTLVYQTNTYIKQIRK